MDLICSFDRRTAAEYRRELAADTWRFCSNCSQWPTSDFISTADLTGRPQICTEYVAIVGLFVALEDCYSHWISLPSGVTPSRLYCLALSIGVNGRRDFFCGDHFLDLLSCAPMLLSSLITLGILWHVVQIVPGFLESVAYVFGILLASFTLDACLHSDVDNET